jgi:hypothetical protein
VPAFKSSLSLSLSLSPNAGKMMQRTKMDLVKFFVRLTLSLLVSFGVYLRTSDLSLSLSLSLSLGWENK